MDEPVKSPLAHVEGLWKNFEIRGVVASSRTRTRYNEVGRSFYESINMVSSPDEELVKL